MRPSIIFATAEYVKRLREECLRVSTTDEK